MASSSSGPINPRLPSRGRKRPMRMRVKKYNVDVTNSTTTIDMTGRINDGADGADTSNISAEYLGYLHTVGSSSRPYEEDVPGGKEESKQSISLTQGVPNLTVDREQDHRNIKDSDRKEKSHDNLVDEINDRDHHSIGEVIETHDNDNSDENDDQEDEDSTRAQHSLDFLSSTSNSNQISSTLTGFRSNISSDDEAAVKAAQVLAKYDNARPFSHEQAAATTISGANQSLHSTSSGSSSNRSYRYDYPESIYSKSEGGSAHSSSFSQRQKSRPQRPPASRAIQPSGSSTTDLTASKRNIGAGNFMEQYKSIYGTRTKERNLSNEASCEDAKEQVVVAPENISIDDNEDNNDKYLHNTEVDDAYPSVAELLANAKKGLKASSERPKWRKGNDERKPPCNEDGIVTTTDIDNPESGKDKGDIPPNPVTPLETSAKKEVRTETVVKLCDSSEEEEQEQVNSARDPNTDMILEEKTHSNKDEKESKESIHSRSTGYSASENSVNDDYANDALDRDETTRSNDRERRLRLWEEQGIYVPESPSKYPQRFSESESSSSVAFSKEQIRTAKQKKKTKKFWSRMGSLFHKKKAKEISPDDNISCSSVRDAVSVSVSSEYRDEDEDENFEKDKSKFCNVENDEEIEDNRMRVESRNQQMGYLSDIAAAAAAMERKGRRNTKIEKPIVLPHQKNTPINHPPKPPAQEMINSAILLQGRNKLKSVQEPKNPRTSNTAIGTSIGSLPIAAAAAAMAMKKRSDSQSTTTEQFDRVHQSKKEKPVAEVSLADQIAAAALARKTKSSNLRTSEDYDKLYQNRKPNQAISLTDEIAAAAIAKKKKNSKLASSENYDKLYQSKENKSFAGVSLADQIAAAAVAKRKQNPNLQTSEDYDNIYRSKQEQFVSKESLVDQIAAIAMERKERNPQLRSTEDYDRLYQSKQKVVTSRSSLPEQVALLALSRKNADSHPKSAEDYDKIYKAKKDSLADEIATLAQAGKGITPKSIEDRITLYKSKKETKGDKLADDVAAAAIAIKGKNQSTPRLSTQFDGRSNSEKEQYGGSLADQVASAAAAVKLKNRSSPMTEEDYDKIYQPKKEASGGALAAAVAAAAMAVKSKNKSSPMTEEDYDKLYQPKPRTYFDNLRQANIEANPRGGSLADQVAAIAIAKKGQNSQLRSIEEKKTFYETSNRGEEECKPPMKLSSVETKTATSVETELENESINSADVNYNVQPAHGSNYSEKDLEMNAHSASSHCSHSLSSPVERIETKRRFSLRFGIICSLMAVLLIGSGLLVYFFAFSHTDDNSSNSTPIQFPTIEPSLPRFETKPPTIFTSMPTSQPTVLPTAIPPLPGPVSQPILTTSAPILHLPTGVPTRSQSPSPHLQPSVRPTMKPTLRTSQPTTLASKLLDILLDRWPPLQNSLNVPSSPQSEAFQWLLNDNFNVDTYSEEKIVQRFVMATFFFSTNGKQWSNNSGWLSNQNECLWYQTKNYRKNCDDSGTLINLELEGNNLSGSLPPELAMLSSSLARLDLAKDDSAEEKYLSGTLPTEIGLLKTLQFISLNGQKLSGAIPDEINQLSLLTVLDLEKNEFEGSLTAGIGNLQFLNNLYLGSNKLSGRITSDLGKLQYLVNLDLSSNRLSSTIPSELGNLSYLQSLMLSNNKVTGTIPTSLGKLSNLQGTFDLGGNFLSGTIPSEFGQLSLILTLLDLSSNRLTGSIPPEMDRLDTLGNLQLRNNLLTGSIPSTFFKLSNLQFLQLENNDLTGEVSELVCNALVTQKVKEQIPPTLFVTDCAFAVDCECCQYCCAEGTGCECQFSGTSQSYLCKYGEAFEPGFRMAEILF